MVSDAPDAGDLVWINFTPQSGREQAGVRPAVVLSPISYNQKVGLLVACPVTTKAKGYGFEVALPAGLSVSGVILTDQVKSIHWQSRGLRIVGRVPAETMKHVKAKIKALLVLS